MTCSCGDKVVSGCNKDLSKLGTCPVRNRTAPIPFNFPVAACS